MALPENDGESGFAYDTDPFDQWIECRSLFPEGEPPALVIHCKKKSIGSGVWSWETQTVCWLDASEVEVGYQSIRIQTYWYYGFDSGPSTSVAAYWPVDLNEDGLHDLLVVAWEFGEHGEDVQDETGEWVYKRFPYDRPAGLRLVKRNEVKGWPCGIASDEFVEWSDVLKEPSSYRGYIQEALRICKDEEWRDRLTQMDELLGKEAADSPSRKATQNKDARNSRRPE